MSATNRGTKRNKSDFYTTPEDVIINLLNHHKLSGNIILEPCAGNGNVSKIIKQTYPKIQIDQIEIRPEEKKNLQQYGNVFIDDFLNWKPKIKYSTIITNPPYSLAQEFVEKSLKIADEVIMLLRLAFLESKKRYEFWQQNPVNYLYILSQRPSFTGKGTDATAYAWFVWNKNTLKQKIKVI